MKTSRINIIWLTPEFPSDENDTKGIYLFRTVKELSKYYNITVLSLYPAAPPIIEMMKYWKDRKKIYQNWKLNYSNNGLQFAEFENLQIFYLRYFRLPRGKFHHVEGWFAYFQAKKIINNLIDPKTIIHANWIFPAGTLARIISKKYNVPYLISLMGSDVKRLEKGTTFWKFAKKLLLDANKVAAVTDDLFEHCKSLDINIGNNNKILIDNIYETDKFVIKDRAQIRNLLGLENSKKYILFAGGLVPVKNVDILIEAFFKISQQLSNANLIIAGSGSEEGILKRLVEELNIQNKVQFVGVLNSEKIIAYYNASDILCLPSKSEGLPNVIVEAMFCGTPVVASKVGGIPSIVIEGVNGYLVNPNSSIDLSERLLLGLKENWQREKIRSSISHLSSDNVLIKYRELYNSILEN